MSENVLDGHFRRFSSRNSFDEKRQKPRVAALSRQKPRRDLFVRWETHLTNRHAGSSERADMQAGVSQHEREHSGRASNASGVATAGDEQRPAQ